MAIGELADGLEIDLNKVPLKYQGLNGTEIAISESQERMSVVVRPEDADAFIAACAKENIDAVVVATVTEKPSLVMTWNGQTIVDIERSFLDTNGVRVVVDAKVVDSQVAVPEVRTTSLENLEADTVKVLSDLNHASQKGLKPSLTLQSAAQRSIIQSVAATKSRQPKVRCRNYQFKMV